MNLKDQIFQAIIPLADYLKRLQISTKSYPVKLNSTGSRSVRLLHPGEVSLDVSIEHFTGYKRFAGLGLESDSPSTQSVKCIDYGGIYDPIDGFVPGDHYAASHYALLETILINQGLRNDFSPIQKAFDFQLANGKKYPFSAVEPHWEFNNLAWLEVMLLLPPRVDQNIIQQLNEYLFRAPRHIRPHAANWKMMLGSFLIRLGKNSKSIIYQFLGKFYIYWALRSFETDGCIADIYKNSRTIQYHFYAAAVLARLALVTNDQKLKKVAVKAAQYGSAFIDPDGNFNYKGRGQGQIFGYASAIYLFIAAASSDAKNRSFFLETAGKVLGYLRKWQKPDGSFPLILNGLPDEKRVGWHDYHHYTVYNAFLGAWLGLAALDIPDTSDRGRSKTEASSNRENVWSKYFSPSGTLIASSHDNYYFCVSRGESFYDTDTGFAPHHIWWKGIGAVISCPGGPDRDRYGKQYRRPESDWNYFAPMVQINETMDLIGPARVVHGEFVQSLQNSYQQTARYGGCLFVRTWEFNDGFFLLNEEINILNSQVNVYPINIPLLVEEVILQPKNLRTWVFLLLRKNIDEIIKVTIESTIPLELVVTSPELQSGGKTIRIVANPVSNVNKFSIRYDWGLQDKVG